MVGAAHGSRAGVERCLRGVLGGGAAARLWSHLLPAEGRGDHSQVTPGRHATGAALLSDSSTLRCGVRAPGWGGLFGSAHPTP